MNETVLEAKPLRISFREVDRAHMNLVVPEQPDSLSIDDLQRQVDESVRGLGVAWNNTVCVTVELRFPDHHGGHEKVRDSIGQNVMKATGRPVTFLKG
ncbi:MAG: hypothetical protein H6868_04090 [Rhodospirillales bacterium]|nr:hypothetical protein [Rhodospirillales bacterium]